MIDLLINHVSIRKYKDKAVDRKILDTIIECAQMAPTSSHLQTYTIIEVKDKSKKEELARISGDQRWVAEAPVVLLFCADLHRCKKYFNVDNNEVFTTAELYTIASVDTALAAQKAFIAAQSLGLGGVIVGGMRNDMMEVHDLFKLPDLVAPLFLMCLGYPDDNPDKKPRLPKDIILKTDYYDESKDDELINEYNKIFKEYYTERTKGRFSETWTEKSSRVLSAKDWDETGKFLKNIGFLKK